MRSFELALEVIVFSFVVTIVRNCRTCQGRIADSRILPLSGSRIVINEEDATIIVDSFFPTIFKNNNFKLNEPKYSKLTDHSDHFLYECTKKIYLKSEYENKNLDKPGRGPSSSSCCPPLVLREVELPLALLPPLPPPPAFKWRLVALGMGLGRPERGSTHVVFLSTWLMKKIRPRRDSSYRKLERHK